MAKPKPLYAPTQHSLSLSFEEEKLLQTAIKKSGLQKYGAIKKILMTMCKSIASIPEPVKVQAVTERPTATTSEEDL